MGFRFLLLSTVGLLLLISQPVYSGQAPAPPAAVVRRVAFGPQPGNGIGPVQAVVDAARNRCYTLNQGSRNLSVVSLKQRWVAAVVSLDRYWTPHPDTLLLLDPHSDRLIIATPASPREGVSRILAVSTRTLQIVEVRDLEGAQIGCAALNVRTGELYVSTWRYPREPGWSIEVFDTRTLAHRRRLPTREVVALAVAEGTGVLLTGEPDQESPSNLGPRGPYGYGSARVVARDPQTGREQARSRKLPRLSSLLPDPAHSRVLAAFGGTGEATLVADLRSGDLSSTRELSFRPMRGTGARGGRPAFRRLLLDARRARLIAELENPGELGVLSLSGPPQPRVHRFDPHSDPAPTLAAVHPVSGQVLSLYRNGIRALQVDPGRTLRSHRHPKSPTGSVREVWRMPVGAVLGRIHMDPQAPRLLVEAETDDLRLHWVEGTRTRPLLTWEGEILGFDNLLMVNCRHRWLYHTAFTLAGAGGYLRRLAFDGKKLEHLDQGTPGHLYLMTAGETPGRTYRAFVPFDGDPQGNWLGVYEGEQEVRRIPLAAFPQALRFAGGQLYLVYETELKPLSGAAIPLPSGNRQVPSVEEPARAERRVPVDLDTAAGIAWYASPADRVLYRLRLADGQVMGARRLGFTPSALALDSRAGLIHLADGPSGTLISVRCF